MGFFSSEATRDYGHTTLTSAAAAAAAAAAIRVTTAAAAAAAVPACARVRRGPTVDVDGG